MYHASANGHSEIVRWILIWSAVNYKENRLAVDIEWKDAQEKTALHNAGSCGASAMVQVLLDYGADVMALTSTGNTPLHVTCAKPTAGDSSKECIRILLAHGADKDKRNKSGQTPSQIALMSGNIDISDFIKKWTPDSTTLVQRHELGQLVEQSRAHWSNIKKMMSLGAKTPVSATPRSPTSPSFPSSPSNADLDNFDDHILPRRASNQLDVASERSQRSLPSHPSIEQGSIESLGLPKLSIPPPNGLPPPQSPPATQQGASSQATSPARSPRLPPPPPPGSAPPTMGMTGMPMPGMFPNGQMSPNMMMMPGMMMPGMFPNGAQVPPNMMMMPGMMMSGMAIPGMMMPGMAMPGMPGMPMAPGQSPADLATQLAKMDEERRRLEAEIEKLRLQQQPK